MTFQEGFGDYQRQLFAVDSMALPVDVGLEQVELLGTEVVPVLRREMETRRSRDPRRADPRPLVAAKYGDAGPRQPRPNPNRGDNLSGTSPYQGSDASVEAHFRRRSDGQPADQAGQPGLGGDMFRAQATLALEFEREGDWGDLLPREYGVMYALSKEPGRDADDRTV